MKRVTLGFVQPPLAKCMEASTDIELSSPVVQTELHDAEMGEAAGRRRGMPVDAFAGLAYQGLAAGKGQIVSGDLFGQPEGTLDGIIDKRRAGPIGFRCRCDRDGRALGE
jgi:hypothetical protein